MWLSASKATFQETQKTVFLILLVVGELIAKVPQTLSVETNGYVGLQLRKKYMVAKSLGLTGYL
jgi:hypothetical protein